MSLLQAVANHIRTATGEPLTLIGCEDIAGGCINRTAIMTAQDGRRYFGKFNDATRLSMFDAELEGLQALAHSRVIRVPRPVCTGRFDEQAFLVLEYLELSRERGAGQRELGQRLARLHRAAQPQFGWHRSNTIGPTPQRNDWCDDWIEFYREHRLRAQFALADRSGEKQLPELGERLIEVLPVFFKGYRPVASLLHGDLWSGNVAATRDGEPTIYDPAVYFGDRETDLAMTELFGGFSAAFYDAYQETWPLDAGYRTRKVLYNLYHVLNHFNLFGGGYKVQAQRMMQQLLSELH